jgi:hypothetical protein
MTIIVSVLKQGPEYGVKEAQFLHNQLKDYESVCLTDISIPGVQTYKLKYDWPGWWSKLELFNNCGPVGDEDLLYIDIDTLITGDLTELIKERTQSRRMTMLTDFYNEKVPTRPPASGVMFIPKEIKSVVWNKWFEYGWENAMRDFVRPPRSGDQGFIGHVLPHTDRWQTVHPGAVLSYKKDVAGKGMPGYHNVRSEGNGFIPASAKIVCFHGKPRPWHVDYQKLLDTRGLVTA